MVNTQLNPQISIPEGIFRAYDIRGVAMTELSEEVIYLLGRAIASELAAAQEHAICVACDGRLSSPVLAHALVNGLIDSGAQVIDLGCVPTPLLYYGTHTTAAKSGIMLTGSHNPKEYNGLKIVLNHHTLKEEGLLALHNRILSQNFSSHMGQQTSFEITPYYIDAITESVALDRHLKIVIDCGNGATGLVAPALYRALGCEVIELFTEIDGNFPNHHPDPGQPKNLESLITEVKKQKADIGLAFDGDGDRLGIVTNTGQIIWPDRVLMLFAQAVLKNNSGRSIIYDVKCSRQLKTLITAENGIPVIWKTGHALIKAKTREINAVLAGEMSGHFFFSDRWYGFDDALYAGARVLEILAQTPCSTAELFALIPTSHSTPELNIAIPEHEKFTFIESFIKTARFTDAQLITIDGLRVEFQDGFGLIRASNTTPNLVLRFEGDSDAALRRIQNEFRQVLVQLLGDYVLPF